MSSTENVRKFRERQKAKGLAEVRGIYLPKKYHIVVKDYVEILKHKDHQLSKITD